MENTKVDNARHYKQRKTVTQCEELGIQLKKFRADGCCYEKNTIEYLEQNVSPLDD